MYRIAICDDVETELEYVARVVEKTFAEKNVELQCKIYTEAVDLLNDNQTEPYDLIFLDLDMPNIDGMDTANRIGMMDGKTELVFVTNHEELVYKAYRFKAIGFIRKKYLEEEIYEIIDNFLKEAEYGKQSLVFKDSGKLIKMKVSDIIYMQSKDHYVDVVTQNNKCVVRDSMNNIEKMCAEHGFIRVHARYMVNCRYIYSIGKDDIVLINKQKLPMSRSRSVDVKKKFQYFLRR